MNPSPENPVVIAGSGWAGLAAAVELSTYQVPVCLIESARQPGGRARSIRFGENIVDNGQHLFIGAYQSLFALMTRVGVDLERVFLRAPLSLTVKDGPRTSLKMSALQLPAPVHLFAALITARGLSLNDRGQALRFGAHLDKIRLGKRQDISVQALLHSEKQTPALVRKLWEPLCIATLNTPIQHASARIFIRVLKEVFLERGNHSDLLFARTEISDLLPRPCLEYLEQRGARVQFGHRVTGLEISSRKITAAHSGMHRQAASHLVLATPHIISRRLLSHHESLEPLCRQLAELGNEPIATLYIQYPQNVRLPEPMIGLEGTIAQWIFDRRICGQPGLFAVVISARGPHMDCNADELSRAIFTELERSFPQLPAPQNHLLVRDKRATFSSRVGVDAQRPGNQTAIDGLWLAGDYTDTGLPATLEGAIRSGRACAQRILESIG